MLPLFLFKNRVILVSNLVGFFDKLRAHWHLGLRAVLDSGHHRVQRDEFRVDAHADVPRLADWRYAGRAVHV